MYITLSIKVETRFAVLNCRSGICPLSVIQLPRYGLTEYIKYDFRETAHGQPIKWHGSTAEISGIILKSM